MNKYNLKKLKSNKVMSNVHNAQAQIKIYQINIVQN